MAAHRSNFGCIRKQSPGGQTRSAALLWPPVPDMLPLACELIWCMWSRHWLGVHKPFAPTDKQPAQQPEVLEEPEHKEASEDEDVMEAVARSRQRDAGLDALLERRQSHHGASPSRSDSDEVPSLHAQACKCYITEHPFRQSALCPLYGMQLLHVPSQLMPRHSTCCRRTEGW